jgi:hypothetical protein
MNPELSLPVTDEKNLDLAPSQYIFAFPPAWSSYPALEMKLQDP